MRSDSRMLAKYFAAKKSTNVFYFPTLVVKCFEIKTNQLIRRPFRVMEIRLCRRYRILLWHWNKVQWFKRLFL